MKPTNYDSKSNQALDNLAINGDNETNDNKTDRKETAKIKFVERVIDNDQNYHTPISFKMNKFMMCFKSEPDLSRVQNYPNGNENVPALNRGRFIARKLLSGVSMVNLRRPFANPIEKVTTITEATSNEIDDKTNNDEHVSAEALEVSPNDIDGNGDDDGNRVVGTVDLPAIVAIDDNKIDDDDEDFVDDEEVDREYDDSVDKENRSPLQCKTIEYISKLKSQTPTIGCSATLSDSMANDSVSPITKSTIRMSKAMQVSAIQKIRYDYGSQCNLLDFRLKQQESIMTPRSRKPVIIGGIRGLATDNYHQNFIDFQMDEVEESFDQENTQQPLESSLHRSKSESSLSLQSPLLDNVEEPKAVAKTTSDETLSTPFR